MKNKLNFIEVILFFISAIVISNQIALMQFFSYQQWYHFASVIISMALIGFGISGLIIKWLQKNIHTEFYRVIDWILIIAAFSFAISLLANQFIIGSFDSFLIFFDLSEAIKFFLTIINFTVTFTLLALVIGLSFSSYPQSIGRLYFWNLFGSALGGIVVVILLGILLPQQILVLNGLIISFLLLIRVFAFGFENLSKVLFLFITIIINLILLIKPIELSPSQFKSISRLKNLPDFKIEYQKTTSYGIVEKISSGLLRYSPGLSLNYTGKIPNVMAILVNGDIAGYALPSSSEVDTSFLRNSTLFLPYTLKEFRDVLILNPLCGIELNRALNGKIKNIYATELNPEIFNFLKQQFGRLKQPNLELFRTEPRNFIEKSKQRFDLIYHPVIEPVGLISGLYSIQEKFLLTKEAFQKIYERLNDNGYFSISCYLDNPPRTFLRVLNLLLSIKNENGEDLSSNQLIAINNWNVITFVLKKGIFSQDEISTIKNFCDSNQFDFLIRPNAIVTVPVFNSIFDNQTLELINSLLIKEEKVKKNYLFEISPPSDDKPYFSNFLKVTNLKSYLQQISLRTLTYSEVGYFLIWVSFCLILIIAFLLLSFGYIKARLTGRMKLEVLIYFALIGIAFMLIELSLIQKFILIFTTDIFSISFVISSLLISSGLGSLFTSKISNITFIRFLIFIVIFLYGLMLIIFSNFWVEILISFNSTIKFMLSLLLVFPLGIMMGMPFPLGIKIFSSKEVNAVPFAWAVNGSFSVIGSIGAVILLINFGFKLTFMFALILYLLCGLSFLFRKNH